MIRRDMMRHGEIRFDTATTDTARYDMIRVMEKDPLAKFGTFLAAAKTLGKKKVTETAGDGEALLFRGCGTLPHPFLAVL